MGLVSKKSVFSPGRGGCSLALPLSHDSSGPGFHKPPLGLLESCPFQEKGLGWTSRAFCMLDTGLIPFNIGE